jgi:protein-S-isoprenylcysteine O-methyltransferase Ste14
VTPGVLVAIVLLAYVSLMIELTVLHVSSVASSRTILLRAPDLEASYSPKWRNVFGLPRPTKLALFILPVLVVWGVYLYPSIALLGAGDFLGDHLFSTTRGMNITAGALIVVGRAVTLVSVLALRRDGEAFGDGLTTEGPFRYSRNPGLVGMYTFVTGLWIAAPSLTMLCGILVYVVHMDVKVRMEEDYLGNTLGEVYRVYQRRTGRYLL